jgi:hypothetical protein
MASDLDHQSVFDDLCEHSAQSACILAIELVLVVACVALAFLI